MDALSTIFLTDITGLAYWAVVSSLFLFGLLMFTTVLYIISMKKVKAYTKIVTKLVADYSNYCARDIAQVADLKIKQIEAATNVIILHNKVIKLEEKLVNNVLAVDSRFSGLENIVCVNSDNKKVNPNAVSSKQLSMKLPVPKKKKVTKKKVTKKKVTKKKVTKK